MKTGCIVAIFFVISVIALLGVLVVIVLYQQAQYEAQIEREYVLFSTISSRVFRN